MFGMGKRYRVVLSGDGRVRAWPAQTRSQALARFGRRVADSGFTPFDGQRLMVLSEEEWTRLGGPESADEMADDGDGATDRGGLFGWLSRSR